MASLLPSRLDFHVWTSKPAQLMKVKKTMTQVAKQGEERAKKQGIDQSTCASPQVYVTDNDYLYKNSSLNNNPQEFYWTKK